MTTPTPTPAPTPTGRRTATRRSVNPTVVLALLLPLLTVGALLLVRTHDPIPPDRPPVASTLRNAAVACPSAPPRGPATIGVATGLDEAEGDVEVSTAGSDEPSEVRLRAGAVTGADVGTGAAVVRAEGDLAPGLLAARFTDRPVAAVTCPEPAAEMWFTGVGAGSRHSSVLELVNPDAGPAVADITLYGRSGTIDATRLRGVTVGPHDSLRLDLDEVIPRRPELALHVTVTRGRLSTTVLDEVPLLGGRPRTFEWMPGQAEPALDTTLLGLPPGTGTAADLDVDSDVLAVANPGEDEARVEVRILTRDASFAPKGLEELRVPPQAVGTVTLTSVLREAMKDGAIGVQVTSTVPVTSSLRTMTDDDLSFAAPVLPSDEPTTLAVPAGTASVVLGDAAAAGVATVTTWSASGEQLEEERFELAPGSGGVVDLPKGTALVRVTPQRTTVHAAALVTDPGAAVLGFRELVTEALLPDVEQGQP